MGSSPILMPSQTASLPRLLYRNGKSFLYTAVKCASRGHEIVRCMQETTQWPSVTASYLRLPVSHYPLTVTLRNGAAIELLEPTDVSTLWQIFFHRAYPVYPSDRSILDAGANIGLFALYAARRAPASTIYCIEPFPDTFNRLCETVRKNRLSDRVICSNLALAGNAGTYLMGCGPRPSQRRQLLSEQTAQVRSLPVSGTTLEIWMNDKNVGELDLMKMEDRKSVV